MLDRILRLSKRAGCLALLITGACSAESQPADPIPDVPLSGQRTISRSDLGPRWPLTVGTGTLGCTAGGLVFRAGGVNYALKGTTGVPGLARIDAIQATQGSGPPSNPLGRLTQETRLDIFAKVSACERTAMPAGCRQRLREDFRLSEPDLKQIEAEGTERFWPPLTAPLKSLDPLVEEGLKLCPR